MKMIERNAGLWSAFGASVKGSGHARRGLPNQDAWRKKSWPWGDLIVVCDGLGSMPEARRGAEAACEAVALAASELAAKGDFSSLPERVHNHWLTRILPMPPEVCGSTCLFALATDEYAYLGQLGDGMAIACGASPILLEVENEFANVTHCLERKHFQKHWQFHKLKTADFYGFALATDGVAADVAVARQPAFAEDLLASYGAMPAPQRAPALAEMLSAWPAPENTDDKTIACLWRNKSHVRD